MVKRRPIPFLWTLITLLFLMGTLFLSLVTYDQPPHMALIAASALAALVALLHGFSWKSIEQGMIHGITLAMGAVLILFIIGIMIGIWILAGIVPSMIYYGLKLLSPGIFLTAALIICSIVALGTGSSWSTAGTIGVALIGVGRGLGIPLPMVAGAIISGAYFGDKMSPLSDTTNLAPAVAGTDLFSHIRHMVYTTVPAYVIALILFTILGFRFAGGELDAVKVEQMLVTLESGFFIHPVMLLPPCLVIFMVIRKTPALPALLVGAVLGGFFAFIFQSASISDIFLSAFSGYTSLTGVLMVDELLSRGGLMSMMETVALILCALSFGGIMEKTGMLEALAETLLKKIRKPGSLIAATLFSCILTNAAAPNQYMSLVIPGRMFKPAYDKMGLHPKNLSRCLEDAGTLSSPLIPWNSCGAFMHATLGVSPLLYLPYAFLNVLSPLFSLFYGYAGITIVQKDP